MIRYILLLTLFIFMPFAAQAKLDTLPEVQALDINTFVSNAQKIEKKYEQDSSLDFSIEIPKNFIIRDDANLKNDLQDNRLIGEVFHADGPAVEDLRPYVSVQSIKLDRLISAKNWFVSEVLKMGHTLRGLESSDDEKSFEAFYIRLDDFGRTEIIRARGVLNEDRLVLVEYSLPVLLWESDRDTQIFSIKSFEFLNKFAVTAPEALTEYSYLDGLYVEFPASWIFKANIADAVNRVDLNFRAVDRDKFVFSDADLTVVSALSLRDKRDKRIYPIELPEVIKARQKVIYDLGFDTDEVMERHDLKVGFPTALNVTEVYPLRKKTPDDYVAYEKNPIVKEFWMTVIKTPKDVGKNYVLTMIMPPRDQDMEKWALAVATYKHMIRSLR